MALVRAGAPHEFAALRTHTRDLFGSEVNVVDPAELGQIRSPVALPWIRAPHSIAPVVPALRLALRGRRAHWIDLDGTSGRCGIAFFARECLRYLVFRVLDAAIRVLAWAVSKVPPIDHDPPPNDHPGLIVLPVVPDLSHTFVYREAARVAELDPRTEIVVLERGLSSAPDHAEGRAIAAKAGYLPRRGILARYTNAARWLLGSPRRCSKLLRLYAESAGGRGALFGKLPMREPRHPGNAFELAAMLRRQPAGPIHVYGSTYAANVAMGAGVLLHRRYSITSYVDFDFDYDHRMLPQKVATSRFFRVCTSFCRDRVLQLVAGTDRARVPVILFGLDLEAWSDPANPARRGVLFSASRLVPKKGLHHMPPALAALRARGIEFEWRVAGDGPERVRLEALVQEHGVADRVNFLGSITTAQVHDELRTADLAVLPCIVAPDGERDGIPIFFTEAMALGVPILTTPVSGIPELVDDDVTGFLATPDDWQALAERLHDALTDNAKRSAVAAAGRALVHERLDVGHAARELLDLVRSS